MNADLQQRPRAWFERHYPLALYHTTGEYPVYETQETQCSSLLPPHTAFAQRFSHLGEFLRVVGTRTVRTQTLDAWYAALPAADSGSIDFLQVDVQVPLCPISWLCVWVCVMRAGCGGR